MIHSNALTMIRTMQDMIMQPLINCYHVDLTYTTVELIVTTQQCCHEWSDTGTKALMNEYDVDF